MLNKRGFLALLNWVERTDLWSKERKKKTRERRGEGEREREEVQRGQWEMEGKKPPSVPLAPGLCPLWSSGKAGAPAIRLRGLAQPPAQPRFQPAGCLGPSLGPSRGSSHCLEAFPLQPPRASPAHLVLRPVSPWAAPPPGAFPSPGWPRCLLSSRHTSGHTVRQPAVYHCIHLRLVPAVEEVPGVR